MLAAILGLKNNKAIMFDRVSNEMLKTSRLVITNQLVLLFNKEFPRAKPEGTPEGKGLCLTVHHKSSPNRTLYHFNNQ